MRSIPLTLTLGAAMLIAVANDVHAQTDALEVARCDKVTVSPPVLP